MKAVKKMLLFTFLGLSAISAVKSAATTEAKIRCYTGVKPEEGENINVECDSGVTQCTKTTVTTKAGDNENIAITYGCGSETVKDVGCNEVEAPVEDAKSAISGIGDAIGGDVGKAISGGAEKINVAAKTELCVCTGNLCNSALSNQVNFTMAFSCLMMICLKFSS